MLGILNDCSSLICVHHGSWYFHILKILSNMHFCASGVVQWSYRLSFGDCAVPCTYHMQYGSQSSFVWSLQVWSGRLGRMAILDAQGNGVNNLTNTASIFWSSVPSGLVYKCAYLLGKIGKRSAWNCSTIVVIQTFVYYRLWGEKKIDVWITWSFFVRCPTGLF